MKVVAFGAGRLKSRIVLVLAVFCLFVFFVARSFNIYNNGLVLIEIRAERFSGQVTAQDPKILREINRQLSQADVLKGAGQAGYDFRLVLKSRKGSRILLFNKPSLLYDPRTGKSYALKDRGKCLDGVVRQLEEKNPYGEFLTWPEVNKIFRKYDKARVRDLETGMSFMVQRRAGSNHADVQPLTADDSAIMKKIYGGRWSWKRRAVVVELKGHRIAGSMNGMPHGAGAISGNNFDGHFCIHFRDSKLHSGEINLAHQMMVWKAADVVEEVVSQASPEYITKVMLEAIQQGDTGLSARFIKPSPAVTAEKVIQDLDQIKWMAASEIKEESAESKNRTVKAVVSYSLNDGTQFKNRPMVFKVVRDQGTIPWKIDAGSVSKFLEREEKDDQEAVPDESVYHKWKVDLEM